MAKKAKALCKWKSEEIIKKLGKYSDIVRNPQVVCTKCGRVADKKKWLHKPIALK
jgi:thymidine kinase